MKKNLMLFALAALTLLTACNSNKYRTWYPLMGSQENGKVLIGPDGATYNPVSGAELVKAIPVGLERVRMHARFYLPEGRNPVTQEGKMDIELIEYHQMPTKIYSRPSTERTDEPIFFPMSNYDPYTAPALSHEPGIYTAMNYLDMYLAYRAYMKDTNTPFNGEPVLEIDPQIVYGERGDTINMRLKFDPLPDGGTPLEDTRRNYVGWISFDLQHAAAEFEFPEMNGETPKSYTIKMTYKTFKNVATPDDGETVIRYVTCQWTPADPYGENE